MYNKLKLHAVSFSILSNLTLVIMKLTIGILSGSVAIMSEATHSAIDLLAAFIAWFAVLMSAKPADAGHPYGHGKFENLSGTIEALLIFIAAIWIIYEAIAKLQHPTPITQMNLGILVMGCSALLNLVLANYLLKVGKKTDSIAITADGWHLRTDVYTSIGVMSTLIIIYLGQKYYPNLALHWLDPVTAIAVAILIFHVAIKLTKQAAIDLMDVSLPDNEIAWITASLTSLAPTICGFHKLRTRKSGSDRFIEVHVVVDGNMSVNASHDITKQITKNICLKFNEAQVTVHIEPCNQQQPSNTCPINCRNGCLLPKFLKTI